jgi:hypothetical protein
MPRILAFSCPYASLERVHAVLSTLLAAVAPIAVKRILFHRLRGRLALTSVALVHIIGVIESNVAAITGAAVVFEVWGGGTAP